VDCRTYTIASRSRWLLCPAKVKLEFGADRGAIGATNRDKLLRKGFLNEFKGPFALYDVVAVDVKIKNARHGKAASVPPLDGSKR